MEDARAGGGTTPEKSGLDARPPRDELKAGRRALVKEAKVEVRREAGAERQERAAFEEWLDGIRQANPYQPEEGKVVIWARKLANKALEAVGVTYERWSRSTKEQRQAFSNAAVAWLEANKPKGSFAQGKVRVVVGSPGLQAADVSGDEDKGDTKDGESDGGSAGGSEEDGEGAGNGPGERSEELEEQHGSRRKEATGGAGEGDGEHRDPKAGESDGKSAESEEEQEKDAESQPRGGSEEREDKHGGGGEGTTGSAGEGQGEESDGSDVVLDRSSERPAKRANISTESKRHRSTRAGDRAREREERREARREARESLGRSKSVTPRALGRGKQAELDKHKRLTRKRERAKRDVQELIEASILQQKRQKQGKQLTSDEKKG